ncbi:hypothetical protein [Brucella pituitosa]|uniref:hypothetical protein n=1 Tax=Brucella pituitosa TaxID=571256 RepID=UPI00338E9819
MFHWEFDRGDESLQIDVPGSLISGSTDVSMAAALSGTGIAYCLEKLAEPYVKTGQLQIILPEWASWSSTGLLLFQPPPVALWSSDADQNNPGITSD